jgi:hypothetical protein
MVASLHSKAAPARISAVLMTMIKDMICTSCPYDISTYLCNKCLVLSFHLLLLLSLPVPHFILSSHLRNVLSDIEYCLILVHI